MIFQKLLSKFTVYIYFQSVTIYYTLQNTEIIYINFLNKNKSIFHAVRCGGGRFKMCQWHTSHPKILITKFSLK